MERICHEAFLKAALFGSYLGTTIEAGDIWTWVAIDAETKLVPSWRNRRGLGEHDIPLLRVAECRNLVELGARFNFRLRSALS
jgi:hypothetical protein